MPGKRSSIVGKRCVSSLVGLVGLASALGCSRAHPELYVSAEDGGEVLVIDADRGEVTAHIPVGKRPRGMRLSHDGKLLYVALSGSPRGGPGVDESKLPPPDRSADGIGVIELASKKLLRTLPSGQDPEAFDLSRDDKTLFVSNEETAEMSVVDLAGGTIRTKVPVGHEPEGVTVRPDGNVVYVTAEADNAVFAIDTNSLKVVAQIPTGPRPRAVAFSKDGGTGFVTCENGGIVTVFDSAKNAATGNVTIAPKTESAPRPRPMGAVLAPDGRSLYVSTGRTGSVAVIDVGTRNVTRQFEAVGARPWGIGVSTDGKHVFTANGPSNDVSVIDTSTGQVEKRIQAGRLPWGLVVAPGR
jgi:YVTN family beta-propeller protein